MSDTFSPERFNALFLSAVNSNNREAMDKTASAAGLYVQMKLRENSFFRGILTPRTVTVKDCQREETTENLYYLEDLEPDSIAMRINWRSQPSQVYLTGLRVKYTFTRISSADFSKTDMELRSYKMPLTKIIEQNTLKDIQEQEDGKFMEHVHAGVYLATRWRHNELIRRGMITGSTYNFGSEAELYRYLYQKNKGSGVWAAIPVANQDRADGYWSNIVMSNLPLFNKDVIAELLKILANRQLKGRIVLMHEATFVDNIKWGLSDAGLEITSEIVKEGYKHRTVGGMKFVTTLRDNEEIVNPGCIYMFPDEEFLGKFLVFENTKFWVQKKKDTLYMSAWEEIGGGFGNIRGLGVLLLAGARLQLYVSLQNSAHTVTSRGKLWLINNPLATSIPSVT